MHCAMKGSAVDNRLLIPDMSIATENNATDAAPPYYESLHWQGTNGHKLHDGHMRLHCSYCLATAFCMFNMLAVKIEFTEQTVPHC